MLGSRLSTTVVYNSIAIYSNMHAKRQPAVADEVDNDIRDCTEKTTLMVHVAMESFLDDQLIACALVSIVIARRRPDWYED